MLIVALKIFLTTFNRKKTCCPILTSAGQSRNDEIVENVLGGYLVCYIGPSCVMSGGEGLRRYAGRGWAEYGGKYCKQQQLGLRQAKI